MIVSFGTSEVTYNNPVPMTDAAGRTIGYCHLEVKGTSIVGTGYINDLDSIKHSEDGIPSSSPFSFTCLHGS